MLDFGVPCYYPDLTIFPSRKEGVKSTGRHRRVTRRSGPLLRLYLETRPEQNPSHKRCRELRFEEDAIQFFRALDEFVEAFTRGSVQIFYGSEPTDREDNYSPRHLAPYLSTFYLHACHFMNFVDLAFEPSLCPELFSCELYLNSKTLCQIGRTLCDSIEKAYPLVIEDGNHKCLVSYIKSMVDVCCHQFYHLQESSERLQKWAQNQHISCSDDFERIEALKKQLKDIIAHNSDFDVTVRSLAEEFKTGEENVRKVIRSLEKAEKINPQPGKLRRYDPRDPTMKKEIDTIRYVLQSRRR